MVAPHRAGLIRRFGASLIDAVGIAITGILLIRPIHDFEKALGFVRFVSIDTNSGALMALIVALWGGAWAYPLIEIATGASPGKWMLGLRVRRPDGGPAGILRRLGRAVFKNSVTFIVLPFGMIKESTGGALVCFALALTGLIGTGLAFTGDHRALHDRISGTAVAPLSAPV